MSAVELITVPELTAPPGYAHVAVATGARLVVTAGAPLDADRRLVGEGDVRAQAQQVIDNLMQQLAAGGASGADVLKTTIYVASTVFKPNWSRSGDVVQASPLAAAAGHLAWRGAAGSPRPVGRDRGHRGAAVGSQCPHIQYIRKGSLSMLPKTMTAVRAHGPRDYRVEEVPVPAPGPNEILVEVDACGICASDMKCCSGGELFWGKDGKGGG